MYGRIKFLAIQKNFSINEAVIHLLSQAAWSTEHAKSQGYDEVKPMAEVLSEIRSRPRVNPTDFGLLDSTVLIREDRDR
ncbi:MAG: hypothetical protein H0X31_10885 [Nostocaceae cyanobacterium]|nr:hypothetical protein [Nostocaceae cyanobacterium]